MRTVSHENKDSCEPVLYYSQSLSDLLVPPQMTYFLALLQLAKRLCPFKLYCDSLQGGKVDSKTYYTIVKTHRDETSQVTDLNPG